MKSDLLYKASIIFVIIVLSILVFFMLHLDFPLNIALEVTGIIWASLSIFGLSLWNYLEYNWFWIYITKKRKENFNRNIF